MRETSVWRRQLTPSFSVLDGSQVQVCRAEVFTGFTDSKMIPGEISGVYELDGKRAFIFTVTNIVVFLSLLKPQWY